MVNASDDYTCATVNVSFSVSVLFQYTSRWSFRFIMHPCLGVYEILGFIAHELVGSGAKESAVPLACCCKNFEAPVLDALWESQDRLFPLLKCFPADVWRVAAGRFMSQFHEHVLSSRLTVPPVKSFERIPTKAKWSRFQKYARGMRTLRVDASQDLVASDVLLVLQLRTGNGPLIPKLETLDCEAVSEAFVPFIPLFPSPKTVEISIEFSASGPTVGVASTIAGLPVLCPHIKYLSLTRLPRSPVITEAVSEMLLACNRDSLECLLVDSPLNKVAREVVYRLPKLRHLWGIMQGPTSLPRVALPDLETIHVEWDSGRGWLEGFRGATIGELKAISFRPTSGLARLDWFLEEFQGVALTLSIQTSLSELTLYTSQPWTPNYSSLLAFKRMTKLDIRFSCHGGCPSTVDDNIIVDLAKAMPELEKLLLGEDPCDSLTGVTLKGLVALACHCVRLTELRVHLHARKLAEATTCIEPPCTSESAVITPRADCALAILRVGETLISRRMVSAVALTLLQVFPRLLDINYSDAQWLGVVETIKLFKRIGGHVDRTSKACLFQLKYF